MNTNNTFFYNLLVWSLGFSLLLSGCDGNKAIKKPDVSHINVSLQVQRFENDLLQVDTTQLEMALQQLQTKYPQFVDVWGNRIMGLGSLQMQRPEALQNYYYFLHDTMARNLLKESYDAFTPFDKIQEEFTQAFKYYKYYFPTKPVPQVITCISFFERAAVTYDTTILALSLDMHLGPGFNYPPSLPLYVQQTLTKDYLVSHGMKVMYGMAFESAPQGSTLLAEMIHNGIQLYFLDLVLPDTPDHLKIDYTAEQLRWCVENEPNVWNFFLDKKLLYTTEMLENRKYIYPGPFTSGMPPESPGNTGSWVGWQIVRKFMQENPDTKFETLLEMDPQALLTRSKYKPKP
ncbi:gliding motility lipoprotein GldB [soil metagenome]